MGGFDLGFIQAGFTPLWFCENDKACQKVLARHWPTVPCYDDLTTLQPETLERPDILCGGFPCQDLSVAGRRAGLHGKRSCLWFDMLRLINALQPEFAVIENVPGLISSNEGRDLEIILDGIEAAGYIYDLDILDSQCFGLAQRRQRVFIVCIRIQDILQHKTDSSAQIIAQCLSEVLGSILALAQAAPANASAPSSCQPSAHAADGLRRRIKLFGLSEENQFEKWRDLLADISAKYQPACAKSGLDHGGNSAVTSQQMAIACSATAGMVKENGASSSTAPWRNADWAGLYALMKGFTISTATREITEAEIYMCSQVLLPIASLILQSNSLCPPFWSAASSALTAVQEFINYATLASDTIFGDAQQIRLWRHFLRQALPLRESLGSVRVNSFGEILPLTLGLPRNSAPRRQAGQRVAPTVKGRAGRSGETNFATSGLHEIAPTIPSRKTAGGGLGTDFDCDGGCIPINMQAAAKNGAKSPNMLGIGESGDPSPTLNSNDRHAVAYGFDAFKPSDLAPPIAASQGGGTGPPTMQQGYAVRRLMPVECCRLQGFPDDWLEPQADSSQYKQLGNAVSVPVAKWLAQRISNCACATAAKPS